MVFKDYYKILGLETNKVSADKIKLAYREQAKKYHPDVNVGNKSAEERFKDINEAYRILSEINSRKRYDRMWNNYVGRKKIKSEFNIENRGSIFSDVFSMFFGTVDGKKTETKNLNMRQEGVPKKGENIETQIDISIKEAFYGLDKKISLKDINGNDKNFDIKIPAGIQNFEKIRLSGQGKQGENGAKNGDLFIKVNIKDDDEFKLLGNDVYSKLLITPWEAALGTKANISSIDGEATVIVPKGTQSGELIRINQMGYKNSKGVRGDLVAEVKIMIPKNMTEKEIELFKDLSRESKFNPRNI